MNWIERMYEIKGKEPYGQNSEGDYLWYIFDALGIRCVNMVDIGGGDGKYLSNTKFVKDWFKGYRQILDRQNGHTVTVENLFNYLHGGHYHLVSIDIDGNDYWILSELLKQEKPDVIIAEFNPAFTDSRTIKYNPYHEWAGDDYYGFSFEAGKKLAEKHGYEIIFNVANMNLIMVRKDLIGDLYVPPVTYEQVKFFKESNRTDWEWI